MEPNDFQNHINNNISIDDINPLPLMHNAMSTDYKKITTEGIVPQPCDVHKGQDCAYFYYGRPLHIPKPKPTLQTDDFYVPVCMGVDPEFVINGGCYVAPSDTGAYHKKESLIEHFKGIPPERYALTASLANIRSYIKTFWGSNYNYIHGNCTYTVDPIYEDVVLVRMLEVLKGTVKFDGIDERIKAVEIRTASHCPLIKTAKVMIVPSDLFEDCEKDFPDAMVIPYRATAGVYDNQMENVENIEKAFIMYLIDFGFISLSEEQAS